MPLDRLQKILAQSGVASRRTAERYITDGRVKVNGKIIRTLGAKADLEVDVIEVDGIGRIEKQPHVYIVLHKPEHVITTARDPEGRATVLDLLEQSRALGDRHHEGALPRVYPVGRLDFDAEGLVLLTNDGDLAQQLVHPRYHVPKTYAVKVRGRPEERALVRLQRGVRMRTEDGRLTSRTLPADARVIKYSPSNTWLELTITEGRHHQVKLMCAAVGHTVSRLIRTEFGGITLDNLPAGGWRFLSTTEVERLRAWSSGLGQRPGRRSKTARVPYDASGGAEKKVVTTAGTTRKTGNKTGKKPPTRETGTTRKAGKKKTTRKTGKKKTTGKRKSPERSGGRKVARKKIGTGKKKRTRKPARSR